MPQGDEGTVSGDALLEPRAPRRRDADVVASPSLTGLILEVIRTEFVPSVDTGQVMAIGEGPQDLSFDGIRSARALGLRP